MPFTPSHAIVALPFARGPLLPAAVAVGAMTPDLPLFVRASPLTYGMTHSFAWLPATVFFALALLIVWRGVLRPAARDLSPAWLAVRLPAGWEAGAVPSALGVFAMRGRGRPSLPGAALVVVALVIGVATHINHLGLVHARGRVGTDILPVLDAMWGPLAGYKWWQYGSSAGGLLVLAICALAWLRRARITPFRRSIPGWAAVAWGIALPVILVVAWVGGLLAFGPFTAGYTPQHLAYRVLPPACAAWAIITVVLCIVIGWRRARSVV